MTILMIIASIVLAVVSFGTLAAAKSPMNEIFAGCIFISATILFCSAFILDEIKNYRKEYKQGIEGLCKLQGEIKELLNRFLNKLQ